MIRLVVEFSLPSGAGADPVLAAASASAAGLDALREAGAVVHLLTVEEDDA